MAIDAGTKKALAWGGGAAFVGFLAWLFWPKKAAAAVAGQDGSAVPTTPDSGSGPAYPEVLPTESGATATTLSLPTGSQGPPPTCNPGDPCETSFPSGNEEREAYILAQVQAGNYYMTWSPVATNYGDHTAVFQVSSDALKVNGVRVIASPRLEQQIADLLNASLLTPLVADMAFIEAQVVLLPMPRPVIDTTAAMIDQSRKVDAAIIAAVGSLDAATGLLIADVGKDWTIDNDLDKHPGRGQNYGWHYHGSSFGGQSWEETASRVIDPATGAPLRLIQGRGTRHAVDYMPDYSQNVRVMSNVVWLDGNLVPLSTILTDPSLAPLASHQGVMTVLRQPGVEPLAAIA